MEKIVCEISYEKITSSKGNEFYACVAILANGQRVVLSFDKKLYYIIRKKGVQ